MHFAAEAGLSMRLHSEPIGLQAITDDVFVDSQLWLPGKGQRPVTTTLRRLEPRSLGLAPMSHDHLSCNNPRQALNIDSLDGEGATFTASDAAATDIQAKAQSATASTLAEDR